MPDSLLLASNVLIYAVDRADPRKHRLAVAADLDARSTGTGRVSFQVVHEWANFLLHLHPSGNAEQEQVLRVQSPSTLLLGDALPTRH